MQLTEKETDRLLILIQKFDQIEYQENRMFNKKPKEKIAVRRVLVEFLNLDETCSTYRNFIKKLIDLDILVNTDYGLRMNLRNACYFLEMQLQPKENKIKEINKIFKKYKNPLTNEYEGVDEKVIKVVEAW